MTSYTAQNDQGSQDVYVYAGVGREIDSDSPAEEQVRFKPRTSELAVVRLEDGEVDRLSAQVGRIVARLQAPQAVVDDDAKDRSGLVLDEVTVHVGLSATGHFFFVANASVEAALDITWRREQ